MNKIKLSLNLLFLTNFGYIHPFFSRCKKTLFLGGISSLAGISAFKISEQLRKEEVNKKQKEKEEERMKIILQDPFVQRVLKTGNPLLISLVAQLKRRQAERTEIFSLNDVEDLAKGKGHLCFVGQDELKSKLESIGLSHFVEKTGIVNKLTCSTKSLEELNTLVDQSFEQYFKNLSSWPEDWQQDLKEIMQQRKEHILEIIVNAYKRIS